MTTNVDAIEFDLDELLAIVRAAMPEEHSDALTTTEWRRVLAAAGYTVGQQRMRDWLRILIGAGRMEIARKYITGLDGRQSVVSAYRWIP